jgi:transcriptional regulator with XRE-family HTH domain
MVIENVCFMDRVEQILKQKKLTQKELAENLSLRRPTLSDWKKNGAVPAGDICYKIAEFLNVSPEWLITGNENKSLSNEERWLLKQWEQITPEQKDTVRTLLEKWEAVRTAFENSEGRA